MRILLFTLDYELFGNGSGDVFKHIIEPTNKLLDIAAKYNLKYTFFFEVIEYWKLKEEWTKGNTMGYKENPVVAMENQIRKAFRQGHDIQLHLHPQWVDAVYENDQWKVNLNEWRLGGYHREGEYSLENLFRRGKETLEELLKPMNPNYQCIAVRAGGYNIQPSEKIVKAMLATGFKVDSSIYPGGKETGLLSNYDYTTIDPTHGVWQTSERLEEQGVSEITELPIVAFPMIRLKKFMTWERVKGFFGNVKSAKDSFGAKTSSSDKKSSKLDKVRYFFQTEWQTWDFCLFSPSLHKSFMKQIAKQNREVFVLVGHPKSFQGARGMIKLLDWTKNEYEFKTISELIKN
jgi:hypothetical protein